jgi:hypothetical protein
VLNEVIWTDPALDHPDAIQAYIEQLIRVLPVVWRTA